MNSKAVRKFLSYLLAGLMLVPCGPAPGFAKTGVSIDQQRASQVKAAILKLGTGKDVRVVLTLRDTHKLAGYVGQALEGSFSLVNFRTAEVTGIPYERVRELRGMDVATGTRVSAGIGIGGKLKGTIQSAADLLSTPLAPTRGNGLTRRQTELIVAMAAVAFLLFLAFEAGRS